MPRTEPHNVAFFASPAELRAWLEANHGFATELWVGYRPKASGLPTLTWPEIVDEVLCCGWIDGVRMAVAGGSSIRITPRRPDSIWSDRNVGRVEAMRAEGRMTEAGEAAFSRRKVDRTGVYSFERDAVLDQGAEAALRADAAGWAFWVAQPPGYRRAATHWVTSAVRTETRERRLARLVVGCAAGERLVELTGKPAVERTASSA